MKSYLFIFTFLGVISCSSDPTETGEPPIVLPAKDQTDISYGSHTQQKFDLYLPEVRSASKTKVYIYIHGGGWMGGDKSEINGGIDKIKQTYFPKYAIVNMNYVLAQIGGPNYALPNQINDIQAVIDFLILKSVEYQIKPEFVLSGSSAGAHLAMFYAYTKNNPQVKAVVNIVGPADFNDPAISGNPLSGLFAGLVNPSFVPTGTTVATFASPVTWITNSSVPTLSFYGQTDTTVPISQRDLLEAKLTQKNVPHETNTYNGGHVGWMSEPTNTWMLGKTKNFLNTHNP